MSLSLHYKVKIIWTYFIGSWCEFNEVMRTRTFLNENTSQAWSWNTPATTVISEPHPWPSVKNQGSQLSLLHSLSHIHSLSTEDLHNMAPSALTWPFLKTLPLYPWFSMHLRLPFSEKPSLNFFAWFNKLQNSMLKKKKKIPKFLVVTIQTRT